MTQFLEPQPPLNPNATYTDGNSTVAYYTVTAATQVNAVPADFIGAFVTLIAEGTTVDFLFGKDSAQQVSNAIVATAAGARDAKLGRQLLASQEIDVWLPPSCKYLARIGAGVGQLRMVLSSGKSPIVVTST